MGFFSCWRMAGDTLLLLQRISMDAHQVTRSGSKISGLFSKNEITKEMKDVDLKDFQRKLNDCQMTDFDYNSLHLSQHIQPYTGLDIPRPSVLGEELDIPRPSVLEEAEWEFGSYDVENMDCSIFAELSDLGTTEGTDEANGPKSELPPFAPKPSDGRITTYIKNAVSESLIKAPVASISVASSFLDHNYAAIVPKIPAALSIVESACAVPYERDFGDIEVSKTVKYVERRKKNNIASRRSRETRKRKHVEMQEQVYQLEQRNVQLRDRVAKMEWLSCTMKRSLFRKSDTPSASTN